MPQAATYDELIPALDNGGAAHLTELPAVLKTKLNQLFYPT